MSPTGTRLLRRMTVIAAAALTLVAAGCAHQGSSKPATGADAMTLNVGQISDSAAFFPIFVAEDQGYFTAQGLTLGDRPRLGTGAKLAAAVQSGGIDVAGGVMTDAFNLYQINPKAPTIPASLDTAPLADKVKALKGKKIGITGPGSGTEALLVYLLKQQGLSAKTDVTLVNLGADASASIGALKAGRVDALSFFQPIGQQAETTNVGRIFKGKAVGAFLRAIAKAEQTITTDPVKTEQLLQKYQSTLPPATVKALVPVLQKEIPSSPAPTEQGYQKSADFHQQSGLIPSPPPFATMVPSAFISTALKGGN